MACSCTTWPTAAPHHGPHRSLAHSCSCAVVRLPPSAKKYAKGGKGGKTGKAGGGGKEGQEAVQPAFGGLLFRLGAGRACCCLR